MEKRKAYYVSKKNFFFWVSVLTAICAAVTCLIIRCGTELHGFSFFCYILLPVLAALHFSVIELLDGETRWYRSAIPVFVYSLCMFADACKLSIWPRLLVWCLCVVYAITYYQTVSGKIRSKLDHVALLLIELFVLAIRVFAVDVILNHYRTFEDWLKDAPVLFAMVSVLAATLAMNYYRDDKYHYYWGDRVDGRMVRSLDPMTYVGVYIMPDRNGADNLFKDTFDLTEVERYIRKHRRDDMPNLTFTQIFLAAYCRMVSAYPALNRFISGQHIFSRDGDIVFNMMVKREMSTTGEETSIKLHLSPKDTIYTVSEKMDAAVKAAKAPVENSFDKLAALFNFIPGLFLKFTIWFLKLLDYFGLLPKAVLEISPFHGSVFFTSMASLGIPAIYHHLYDFGNLPVFICLGKKYRRSVLNSDGTVEEKKVMDITVNCDERICDGFYYATVFKMMKRIMMHPEELEQAPVKIVPDAD